MILYENTLISLDLFKIRFICDLSNCLGSCCVEGDLGAPLEPEEVNLLKQLLPEIKAFITNEAVEFLQNNDFWACSEKGEFSTACINNRDCVFAYRHKGILRCAIESAFRKKIISFQKPISCHLYPIRLGQIKNELITVNYNEWSICKPALLKGETAKKPLYQFLKEPLIRKFGEKWYNELDNMYSQLKEENQLQ